jgi:hypothetical protein
MWKTAVGNAIEAIVTFGKCSEAKGRLLTFTKAGLKKAAAPWPRPPAPEMGSVASIIAIIDHSDSGDP